MRNNNNSSNSSSGIGFIGLLQIAFIVLKLCKVINWSWWWILSPLWISTIIFMAIYIIIIITIKKG